MAKRQRKTPEFPTKWSHRTMSFADWGRQAVPGIISNDWLSLTGLTVASAAKELRVTSQRISQLVAVNRLERLDVYDAAGKLVFGIITTRSLDAYKASMSGARARTAQLAF